MFITFEGIEGSGKSLQIDRAVEHLRSRGIRCLVTREPGGTPFGAAVRQILLNAAGPRREPMSELLLYLADRYQHLRELVEPALRGGLTVISDRYHDATRAYQGAARGVPRQVIDQLAALLQIPEPDRTVLLDAEPEVGLRRARSRNESGGAVADEGRFEAEDLSFHRAVRNAYLDLAREFPRRIHIVHASDDPETVHTRIRKLFDAWFSPLRADP